MDTKVFSVDRWKSLRPGNFTIKGKFLEGNLIVVSLCEDEIDEDDFLLRFKGLCFLVDLIFYNINLLFFR